jgi:hypothetical protein
VRTENGPAAWWRHRVAGLVVPLSLCISACGGAADGGDVALSQTGEEAAAATAAFGITSEPLDSVLFEQKLAWMREQRLDTLPPGEAIAALGRTFVGTPYEPGTLEVDGDETLVVNLRALDCVTFVENVLALERTVKLPQPTSAAFRQQLARIRYRDGVLAGYPSRLHYFREWIANNDAKGIVENVTASLGGRVDPEPITFMTRHRDAYRQLADTALFVEIEQMELTLSGRERYFIPEGEIAAAAAGIRNGDVIAATSVLEGLDVAHTGFALWVDGRLHLMHAPLVGSVVEISERPLADRIRAIASQDGIMVARPL